MKNGKLTKNEGAGQYEGESRHEGDLYVDRDIDPDGSINPHPSQRHGTTVEWYLTPNFRWPEYTRLGARSDLNKGATGRFQD